MVEWAISCDVPGPWANDARLGQAVEAILAAHGVARGTVSLALVDDATIHEVNREFLSHDEPTDVISFVLESGPGWLDGEIVASVDTAARHAAEVGWTTADELLLYVIHGLLHLVGHDDLSDEARPRMRAAERAWLAHFGLEPRNPAD